MTIRTVCLITFYATIRGRRFGRTWYPNQITDYLNAHYPSVFVLCQPMTSERDQRCFMEEYRDGKLVKISYMPLAGLFKMKWVKSFKTSHVQHIRDLLSVIFCMVRERKKFDAVISMESVNTLAAIFLKRFGLVKKVAFVATDYMPKRFPNPVLNGAYHALDKLCMRLCDVAWNPFVQMARVRPYGSEKSVYVTVAAPAIPETAEKKRNHIVFMGFLIQHTGPDLALKSFPHVLRQIPDARLHMIGGGPMLDQLKEMTKQLNLDGQVKFHGSLHDEDADNIVGKCVLGLAPFPHDKADWRNTESAKVKLYVGHHLPVLITRANGSAEMLRKYGASIEAEPEEKSIGEAVIQVLEDEQLRFKLSDGARRMAQDFSPEAVFGKGMEALED